MKTWIRMGWLLAAAVIVAAASVAGCDDGGSTVGGSNKNTDTTPPTVASVTAVDQGHVDVEFSEDVEKNSAENTGNYTLATVVRDAEGGNPTIGIEAAALDGDGMTVHLATSSPLSNVDYNLTVSGVKDLGGNTIASNSITGFTGTTSPDVTPPTIVSRTPSPGQTGVGIGQPVMVQFSEPMDYSSVVGSFSWTYSGGSVSFNVQTQDANTYLFSQTAPLLNGTMYTVGFDGGAQDWAGNNMASGAWNFTTTSTVDNTPPTLVSSTPSNNATNVNVTSNVVMTFSEAVDQTSLENVFLTPDLGAGDIAWSNGGRTVTFDPYVDMMTNTQYTLLIIPGGVRDLAGNGNANPISIVWSTGSTLASGSFSGNITGPGSADAPGPGGAVVIAADQNPFAPGGGDNFGIGGSAAVASNGNYSVMHLADGVYYPICAMDSNKDGQIEPDRGDAIGAFGIDLGTGTGDFDSVTVVGGNSTSNVDFSIYDPSAIFGRITYAGSLYGDCCYTVYIGAFDTTGFDPGNVGSPDYGTATYLPNEPFYSISELDNGLTDGTYYIGAYLDVNDDGLDPGDPSALYGGFPPTPVTVENGTDGVNINITLTDPPTAITGSWEVRATVTELPRAAALRRLVRIVQKSLK